jgi:hypothetical protein
MDNKFKGNNFVLNTDIIQRQMMPSMATGHEENLKILQKNFDEKRKKDEKKMELSEKTVEILERLVEIGENNPQVLNQIGTLIENSTITNLQSNSGNATGVQNINPNLGIDEETFINFKETVEEFIVLLNDEKSDEATEMIEALESEIKLEKPRNGIIKACIGYFKTLAKDIILNPSVLIAKEPFRDFAQSSATNITEAIDNIFKLINP